MTWQPIETAPKDGTYVLIIGGKSDEDDYQGGNGVDIFRPVTARFVCVDYPTESGNGYWGMCFWDGEWRTSYETPTHWMPLPEPPK